MPSERPSLAAIKDLYADGIQVLPHPHPQHSLVTRLTALYKHCFGEENFVGSERQPERTRNIRLMEISVEAAKRLTSRGSFRSLDLDETEIITVMCETARILKLEEKVGAALAELRLPSRHRNPDETPRS